MKSGTVLGGTLLVGGSCIGAGMLALPVVTGLCGFFPTLLLLLLSWLFMTFTGLLLTEVNSWFSSEVNIISMSGKILGRMSRGFSWLLYLFLFYSLLVAYISGGGQVFSSLFGEVFRFHFPYSLGVLLFVFAGALVLFLGTHPVDWVNRIFMAGKIFACIGMISLGISSIRSELLFYKNFHFFLLPLPVLVTSFGFHNIIPSLSAYLKGDFHKVRLCILAGSLLTLLVYFFWELLVLGIVPVKGGLSLGYEEGKEISQILLSFLGTEWVVRFAQGFAFFAIVTAFLTQGMSLMHFLADGLKMQVKKEKSLFLCVLTLLPPLLFALTYPKIFFIALNFAGGICATLLFGVLPVLMIYKGRKQKLLSSYPTFKKNFALLLTLAFSLLILVSEMIRLL